MIIQGDCLEELKKLEENSIDAIVTDPPYGLSFMGKKWDYDVPSQEIWSECLRVLKPGGYLLSFAGTRTQHRMAVRIEDAGFEIRDMIAWIYGSGFPKSLNIGKAVDKLQGNEREEITDNPNHRRLQETGTMVGEPHTGNGKITKGTSEWEGWGTALKPALEPITVARKPLSEKNVALNCLKWGVGGINIDGCRVGTEIRVDSAKRKQGPYSDDRTWSTSYTPPRVEPKEYSGRFPANLIHDGSVEVLSLFPMTKGGGSQRGSRKWKGEDGEGGFGGWAGKVSTDHYVSRDDGTGSAARFFYCAKASKSERNRGCEELGGNKHCTVKPIALMEYLVKLVSREGSLVLDPFAGSGSTGIACQNLGRDFILIEREPQYVEIIKARLND